MPKFKITSKFKAVDTNKFYKSFEEGMYKAIRETAAGAALVAAPIVPVYSGMAKGSFLAKVKIERLNKTSTASAAAIFGLFDSPGSIDISSKIKTTRRTTRVNSKGQRVERIISLKHYFGSGAVKGPDAGARASKYEIRTSINGFYFSFESRVRHYDQDVISSEKPEYSSNPMWPTQSFEEMKSEFDSKIGSVLKANLPKKSQYIIATTTKDLIARQNKTIAKGTAFQREAKPLPTKSELRRRASQIRKGKKLARGYSKTYRENQQALKRIGERLGKGQRIGKQARALLKGSRSKVAKKIIEAYKLEF